MPTPLTEAQVIVKATEAIKQHPNTRNATMGPLKSWLSKLYADSTEFRDQLAAKNGNALADYVCSTVEAFSAKQGKPWKRNGPSSADKKG